MKKKDEVRVASRGEQAHEMDGGWQLSAKYSQYTLLTLHSHPHVRVLIMFTLE